MISSTHPTWRPVRPDTEESVEYLNRLFRQGWYLLEDDEDDLPFLMLRVPVKPPKRVVFKRAEEIVEERNQPVMTVMILHKGNRRSRQLAVIMKRDASGYFDFASDRPEQPGWSQKVSFNLDDGETMVTIYERKTEE
jgi:hypothetical protein